MRRSAAVRVAFRSALIAGAISGSGLVLADAPENPWPNLRTPSKGPSEPIGEYSAGCLSGAVALPTDGPGYQVMRLERRRFYGHPSLLGFLEGLGASVKAHKLGVMLVGDLSQARGGRSKDGHASHQTGLDVDIWYTHPPHALKAALSAGERETLSAQSVVDDDGIRPPFRRHVASLLKLAAHDQRVARIFVNPRIKRALCQSERGDRTWLRKVRPWYGHDDHFHVRLACPPGAKQCVGQAEVGSGDGCDGLAYWFDTAAQAARKHAQKGYQQNVSEGRGWPDSCAVVLADAD